MKLKNKILFVLGLLLLPTGLGLLLLYKVLKKKSNRYYIACLLPRFVLWLLQPFFKQDSFILFDTNSIKTQLIDNYTLFLAMQKRGIKSYYLCVKSHPQFKELKKLHGESVIGFKNIDLLYYTLFFKLLTTKAILENHGNLMDSTLGTIRKNKKTQLIFAQHGVNFFKNSFINKNNYSKKNYHKVIICNNSEKELFQTVGFKDEDFIKGGLARWDLLQDSKKKDIFVYFTHRYTFWEMGTKNYKDSMYFKNLEKFLTNKPLQDFLDFTRNKMYVAIHHAIREHLKDFDMQNIIFVDEFEIDRIKNSTAMLITDYSSMCFEYMFKDKPVVFYRLDDKDTWLNEFDLKMQQKIAQKDNEMFNVYYDRSKAIVSIKAHISREFETTEKQKEVQNKFFYFKENICDKIINQL